MRQTHRLIFIFGTFTLLILLMIGRAINTTAQDGPTATPNINWVREPEGILVRGGPGLSYGRIGQLPHGSWVQPLARNADGEWILITYLFTQGWVYRDGVSWRLDTDALPLIHDLEITPIPRPTNYYKTPGGPTHTPNTNWVRVGPEGAHVRGGPGQEFLHVGELFTGDVVDPVARNNRADWILIRYGDGYGWVMRGLVVWTESIEWLPVVDIPFLTPSFTGVPGQTSTASPTEGPGITPSPESSATSTATDTPPATNTVTNTPSPEPTVTATDTPSLEPTATATPSPSPTAALEPTASNTEASTLSPTSTITSSPSATNLPTETPIPTASNTPTLLPTNMPTTTDTRTPTITATETLSPTFTATGTNTPSITPLPTETPSLTFTATITPDDTVTPLAIAAAESGDDKNTPVTVVNTSPDDTGGSGSRYLVLGGMLALAALIYLGVYISQAANLDRYQDGFPLMICPVCEQGKLYMEERRYRILGIPRTRRVVRCSECRSTLREVGRQRWRYAIDGGVNPAMYDELNGHTLSESRLMEISPEYPSSPPHYIEGDDLT